MVRGEEQTSDKIFQLAVNKDGVIRGNYYDAFADNALPVYGSVDKKTQRAAWSIGEKKGVVFASLRKSSQTNNAMPAPRNRVVEFWNSSNTLAAM